jgi:endonuclease/exonuclease/phosphatase (EEP) superfamily protein YafD
VIALLALRACQCVLAAGLLFHLWLRDSIEGLAVVYYMLPWPVLLAVVAAGEVLSRIAKRTWSARMLWALGAGMLGAWISQSWCRGPASPPPADIQADELRVLVWNIGRPVQPSHALIDLVRELNPHFVVVIEPGRTAGDHLTCYDEALPGFKAAWMPRGIIWISRLPSRYRHRGKLNEIGAYAYFEVEWEGMKLPVVAADVYGAPWFPRGPQIREGLAHTKGDPRALLMGDFNTPPGSIHFDGVREQMQDAFEKAGRGFRETWFHGLPVLTLDYLWAGAQWEILETRQIRSAASDHAALFSRMRLRDVR